MPMVPRVIHVAKPIPSPDKRLADATHKRDHHISHNPLLTRIGSVPAGTQERPDHFRSDENANRVPGHFERWGPIFLCSPQPNQPY